MEAIHAAHLVAALGAQQPHAGRITDLPLWLGGARTGVSCEERQEEVAAPLEVAVGGMAEQDAKRRRVEGEGDEDRATAGPVTADNPKATEHGTTKALVGSPASVVAPAAPSTDPAGGSGGGEAGAGAARDTEAVGRTPKEEGESNLGVGTAGASAIEEKPTGLSVMSAESVAALGLTPHELPLGSNGHIINRVDWVRRSEDADEGDVVFRCITNSGEVQDAIWLVCLKNIFAKQLPNMPKEYIVRLLMERNHESMVAIKGDIVVGGITFRTFKRQGFAEIAFCAVTAQEQVKGYGSRLMNYVKEYSRDAHKTTHFLTYADNNAVGYFVKQGFSKEILLEREKWYGYIKDYDGGTMMECPLSDAISYTDFPQTIRAQRAAVDRELQKLSNQHVVYPGLQFPKGGAGRVDPMLIPGVAAAGWQPTPLAYRLVAANGCLQDPTPPNLHAFMHDVHEAVAEHQDAWPFVDAVDGREVPDYYDIIKDPVDLALIRRRLANEDYYVGLEMFAADFRRMFENCRIYNAPDTVYYKCATKLEQFFEQKLMMGMRMMGPGGPAPAAGVRLDASMAMLA